MKKGDTSCWKRARKWVRMVQSSAVTNLRTEGFPVRRILQFQLRAFYVVQHKMLTCFPGLSLRVCGCVFVPRSAYSVCEGSSFPRIHVFLRATWLARYFCPPIPATCKEGAICHYWSHLPCIESPSPSLTLCLPFYSRTVPILSYNGPEGRAVALPLAFSLIFRASFSPMLTSVKGMAPLFLVPNR